MNAMQRPPPGIRVVDATPHVVRSVVRVPLMGELAEGIPWLCAPFGMPPCVQWGALTCQAGATFVIQCL